MLSRELRKIFLDFFASRGHTLVDSSSLVPEQDSTLLFTNSGMVQFKNALAFREAPGYTRAASCQRCVRAGGKHNDLDNVGYTTRHHTFFEMLGNFSFGDYFKKETIQLAWEFLTEVIDVPPERLWVTVHENDAEAERIWLEDVGVDASRFSRLGDDQNFWAMGETGPCGPCSEIFYDHGPEIPGGPPGTPEGELDRYVEIWNLVFTQYDRSADGTLTKLQKPCVDTGMGLERIAAVMQQVHDNYDTDLFQPLIKKVAKLLGVSDLSNPSLRVIADHIRAVTFLISDGVVPSNEGRGYAVRRIIRRALRHGHQLQSQALLPSQEPFFHRLVETVISVMGDAYPFLQQSKSHIEKLLLKEEEQFQLTLDQGMKLLDEAIKTLVAPGAVALATPPEIPGEVVFKLYDTYGFPTDLTADIARERGLSIDMDAFDREMAQQKARARATSQFTATEVGEHTTSGAVTAFMGYETLETASEVLAIIKDEAQVQEAARDERVLIVLDRTPFYAESGGQVGDRGWLISDAARLEVTDTIKSGDTWLHQVKVVQGQLKIGAKVSARVDQETRDTTRLNHSATHLLHAALRLLLGEHVNQRGSLVDSKRLRFDFSHFDAITPEELRAIERLVNEQVRLNTPIETAVMPLEEARKKGALALFGEKYSQDVRVLSMGTGFSMELCGGTHASRTGDIGVFKILSEQGIASGVRRIEAVTGATAFEYIESLEDSMTETASLVKGVRTDVVGRVKTLIERNKKLEKEMARLTAKLVDGTGKDVDEGILDLGEMKLVVKQLDGVDAKSLPEVLDRLKNKIGTGVVVLGAINDGKVGLVAGVTKDLTEKFNAGELVNHVAVQVGGKGGGRSDMARAGGSNPAALPEALASVEAYIRNFL